MPYKIDIQKNYCSCLGWKFQKKPVYARTCKHLREAGQIIPDTVPPFQKYNPPDIMLYSSDQRQIKNKWLYSEKLNGVRGFWDGKKMLSRNGTVIHLPKRISKQLPTDLKLDGEFWGPTRTFQNIVNATQSQSESKYWRGVYFYIFDCHSKEPYIERYNRIKLLPRVCKQTPILKSNIVRKLNTVIKRGGEGLILRDPAGLYKNRGRTTLVVKVKPIHVGAATYIGNNTFKESSTGIVFKMKSKDTAIFDNVSFQYVGRTRNNKPEYPKRTQL